MGVGSCALDKSRDCGIGGESMQNQGVKVDAANIGHLILVLGILLTCTTSNALAQIGTASISGRIDDPSDAPIPGVTVTVTSLETTIAHTATTDDSGTYRVLS